MTEQTNNLALQDLAQSVVERATARGATAAEVYVRQGIETEIAVRNGEIEQLSEGGPKSVGIRLWRDDRSASTYATDFSDDALDRLIGDTLDLAKLTDPVPEAALVDSERLATDIPDLNLFDAGIRDLSAADKLALARDTETAARDADPRITTSGGASYGDLIMGHALANSHGFSAGYQETFLSFSVEVIADDVGGKKRSGRWYSFGRHRDQLESAASVGATAAERAVRQLGAGPVPTRTLPVVFDPYMAASLLGMLFSVIQGGSVERRSSYVADRMGERIGSDLLTLIDDPTLLRAPGSKPYDGEGQPARKTTFIDGGVLKSFALNSYSARKLGLTPTGHSSRPASGSPGETNSNLYLAGGTQSPEALIADIDYGFYCESMMGFGFNPATGDFSRGAGGRLIENGKLTRPVSEVTVSSNFLDLFNALDAVANDRPTNRSTSSPTIRIAQMTLAGT